MPSILIEYQLVIRNAANTADAITFSSVRGDTSPDIEGPPTCDGQEINPLTGDFRSGSYTGTLVDPIVSGTTRAVTSQLEDANFRQQLAGRVAFWKIRTNGGAWSVLGAGYLTVIRLVTGARWEFTIEDATRVEDTALAFSPKQNTLILSANAASGASTLSVSALPFAIAKNVVLYFLSGKTAIVTAAATAGATSISVGGLVTVAAPGASAGATTLPVSALSVLIPYGTILTFASGHQVIVGSGAFAGSTSIAVSPLANNLTAGDTAPLNPALSSGDSAPITEAFVSYFARWPNRGCIFGGPITGGFLSVPDLGGWVMQARETTAAGGLYDLQGTTWLSLLSGYVPPRQLPTQVPTRVADIPNTAVQPLATGYAFPPGFQYEFYSFWPGLVYQIALASGPFTNAGSEFYAPEDAFGFPSGVSMNGKGTNGIVDVKGGNRRQGIFAATQALTINGVYRVRAFTCLPTEQSPLYWSGHPIDLATALLDEQNRPYDATSVTNVRQAIGADRRLSLRITTLPTVNSLLKNAVYAPFGIGVRMNTSGVLEFFTTRIFNNSPPTTTITDADIRHDTEGAGVQAWFELDESTAIRQVIFEYDYFYTIQEISTRYPPDGVGVQHVSIQNTNGDPGAVGSGIAQFSVPGMVHPKDGFMFLGPQSAVDPTVQGWTDQLTYEIFNRWGRGIIAGELPLLRGGSGDSVQVGDEVLNRVPQLPNKNKRYGDDNTVGARAMQIVRLTPSPLGAHVKLIDSGPNANAVATLPTFTIAPAPGRRAVRFAQITITNAPALNALVAGLEIQMAVTTGATPALTDYGAVGGAGFGQIPLGAITLPGVLNGRTVWVRTRSTQVGFRPSNWTTPLSVALTVLAAPTSLSVTPNGSDGTQATAAWTPGTNADQSAVDVYVWVTANGPSTALRLAVLDAGASRLLLEGLIPNTAYTCGVQSRDEQYGDLSAMTTATFTTANVTPTLAAPLYPQWFVGGETASVDTTLPSRLRGLVPSSVARGDGSYGMAVYATAFPAFVEFFEAVETGVGSGSYGSFNSIGTVASVQGDWTKVTRTAPNDGLRRQLKAQHVRDNATASSFTSVGTVSPWGTPVRLALPPFARTVPVEDGNYAATSDSSGQVFLLGAGTSSTQKVNVGTPSTPATMQRIYRVPFAQFFPDTSLNGYDKTNGSLTPRVTGAAVAFIAPLILPQGSTITTMAVRCFKNAVGDSVIFDLERDSSTSVVTGIASGSLSATGAFTTVTVSSIGEAVTSSNLYYIRVQMTNSVSVSDARLLYVEITVTVPDLNTGL